MDFPPPPFLSSQVFPEVSTDFPRQGSALVAGLLLACNQLWLYDVAGEMAWLLSSVLTTALPPWKGALESSAFIFVALL